MENIKKYKILVLISVIIIILGPILGFFFNKIILVNQSFVTSETSNNDVQNATAIEFTLVKDQKAVIEFSAFTENVTANLIILSKGTYDLAYAAQLLLEVSREKNTLFIQNLHLVMRI